MPRNCREIQVEETGPDFVIGTMEEFLTGSKYCDLAFICDDNLVVSAHCSVVSAVSTYLRDLLKEVYPGEGRDQVTIQLAGVGMQDMQHFLELVYTGRVSMSETRRTDFTELLELLNVCDDIGEKVIYQGQGQGQNGHGGAHSIGGGVTLTKVDRSNRRSVSAPVPKKISVAITPVSSASPGEPPTLHTPKLPPNLPDLTPITTPKQEPAPFIKQEPVEAAVPARPGPPPVESLLATLSKQLPPLAPVKQQQSLAPVKQQPSIAVNPGNGEVAAADKATIDWLNSSKVGVPQMVRDGDTGQLSLSHSDAASGRKCEKCRCPLCVDPNRPAGEPAMHLCHYPDCGKVYKKTSHLRAHLRWHIGDQPYLCSWPGCSRKFTRSDELHRHFRIHTGERRHRCEHCGKSFSRSDHLKKHSLSHHSGMPLSSNSPYTTETVDYPDDNDNMETEIDPTQLLEMSTYQDTVEGDNSNDVQLNY